MSRRHANHSRIREGSEIMRFDEGNIDSCPLLGEDDEASSLTQNQQIRSVRLIDNGVLTTKKSFVQRFRSRRNRFIQRALVVLHLAEPSRDQTFNQAQVNNRAEIEQLAAIRSGLFAHSQSIVNLSMAICCFNGNSARIHQVVQTSVVAEGHKIRECSLVFAGQVENSVLAKIDRRIDDLERIDTLIEERTKIVLGLEYAKRVLSVEKQKGNVNHVAQRERQLQAAQQECEQATRFIAEQLKFSRSKPSAGPGEVLQEYAQLTAQLFKRGAGFLDSVSTPQN